MLPPTLYFFIAFNLIVFTTNLLAMTTGSGRRASWCDHDRPVVGKSVLVANQID
jgi:hypothetical protein